MNPAGEDGSAPLQLHFDRSVKLAFRGSAISSDGGLLLYRELDDALGLTDLAAGMLVDARTGRNGRHSFAGLLRQSIYSRLAGYEDVNDADRLCRDPVMRHLVGGRAIKHGARASRWEAKPLGLACQTPGLHPRAPWAGSRPSYPDPA